MSRTFAPGFGGMANPRLRVESHADAAIGLEAQAELFGAIRIQDLHANVLPPVGHGGAQNDSVPALGVFDDKDLRADSILTLGPCCQRAPLNQVASKPIPAAAAKSLVRRVVRSSLSKRAARVASWDATACAPLLFVGRLVSEPPTAPPSMVTSHRRGSRGGGSLTASDFLIFTHAIRVPLPRRWVPRSTTS